MTRLDLPSRRGALWRLGLGAGATLLAPFLRTMEAEAAGRPRKRFLLVLQSNGMTFDRLIPAEFRPGGGDYTTRAPWDRNAWSYATSQTTVNSTAWTGLPPILRELARHKERLLIVDGLANRQNDLRSNHGAGSSAVTCLPNAQSGEGGDATGPSFDQHLAAQPSMSQGVFRSVDLLAPQGSGNHSLLATGPGRALPLVRQPREALVRYFGGLSGEADAAARAVLQRKKRLLDVVRADVARLSRELSGGERDKLEQYLDSIHKIDARLDASQGVACDARGPALPGGLATANSTAQTDIEDVVEAMLLIATEALVCGLTQVASVSIATGLDHYGHWRRVLADIPDARSVHQMSHGEGAAVFGTDAIWAWVGGRIAAAADRLAAASEGGRSILSDSAILWQSSNGGFHHHPGQFRWNAVVLGDAGGKLRADGRYLKYPTAWMNGHLFTQADMVRSPEPNTHSLADLYCTLAHAFGAPTDSFGKDGREPVKGALPEALV